MNKNFKFALILISGFFICGQAQAFGFSSKQKNNEDTYRQLNLFGDVFERVKNYYVEDVKDEELIEHALNGMLTSLDPHSTYLNPEEFKDMQVKTRGEFGGLGIEFIMDQGYVKIITAVDETPAERAGLQPNDLITHIDGKSILNMTTNTAVKTMRGNVGDPITITIRRGAPPESFDVTLTRALIKSVAVKHKVEGNIGYVRITTFSDQTQPGLEKAIKEIKSEIGEDNVAGYILDVRNNPGGLLDEAISVSNTFLNEGEIVSIKSKDPKNDQRFFAQKGDLTNGKPVIVLINAGSASASEIVAGALKDHKRALIVGTRSWGKGSVQTVMPLPGRGAMSLTTALYYTPSGVSIQQLGIDPDIEVHPAKIEEINLSRMREADLENALENGNGKAPRKSQHAKGKNANAKAPTSKDEKIFDYQLERAKDILIGLSIYNKSLSSNMLIAQDKK